MRRILGAAALTLLISTSYGSAAVIDNLGINPTSATGAFSNTVGGGFFEDQYTFQLIGSPQFFTIASVTNVFPQATDFITNFSASVFSIVGAIGGLDDVQVIGPTPATANCGPVCQGMAGSAILGSGNYYAQISGVGGGTSGYGGNLAVAPIPIPAALPLFGTALGGLYLLSRLRQRMPAAT